MPAPQKDWFDIIVDFIFGAIFCDVIIALGYLRGIARHMINQHHGSVLWVLLLASTLIGGSLAALFRNQFWSRYETYSIIPPREESVKKQAKIVLWTIFALGCASLGLLYFC